MSIEIRLVHTNPEICDCGPPRPIGYRRRCHREFVCQWGTFDNAEGDPRRGLKHLMLVLPDAIERVLAEGPEPGTRGGIFSASRDDGRAFAHIDYEGLRTTWELFDAHFWDGKGPEILVGRWPD